MMKRIFYLVLALACGCGDSKVATIRNEQDCRNEWTLVRHGEKSFELDSLSSKFPKCFQYFSAETDTLGIGDYFTFFNKQDYSVYFYNYRTSDFAFKIKMNSDGPDGTRGMDGYSIKSLDSLILYGSSDVWRFNIVDRHGWKIFSFQDDPQLYGNEKYAPYSRVDGQRHVYFRQNEMITAGYCPMEYDDDNDSNRKVITFYENIADPEALSVRYKVPYPALYEKGNWYGAFFREPYFCYNERKGLLAVSFPASHKLSVYDIASDKIIEHDAGSCRIDEISSSPDEYQDVLKEKAIEHYLTNDRYTNILYDPYRDCYYRFALKAARDPKIQDKDTYLTEIYVIILDSDFQYRGEISLSGKEYGVGGFSMVTEDGLLLNYFADKNEDRIVFHTYELTK